MGPLEISLTHWVNPLEISPESSSPIIELQLKGKQTVYLIAIHPSCKLYYQQILTWVISKSLARPLSHFDDERNMNITKFIIITKEPQGIN